MLCWLREHLRLDLDRAAGAPQLDALEVKDAVGEPQAQGANPPASEVMRSGAKHKLLSRTPPPGEHMVAPH